MGAAARRCAAVLHAKTGPECRRPRGAPRGSQDPPFLCPWANRGGTRHASPAIQMRWGQPKSTAVAPLPNLQRRPACGTRFGRAEGAAGGTAPPRGLGRTWEWLWAGPGWFTAWRTARQGPQCLVLRPAPRRGWPRRAPLGVLGRFSIFTDNGNSHPWPPFNQTHETTKKKKKKENGHI